MKTCQVLYSGCKEQPTVRAKSKDGKTRKWVCPECLAKLAEYGWELV